MDQLCVHYLDLSNFLMVGHGWLAMRPARAAKPREVLSSLNLEVSEVIASTASLLYLLQEIFSESDWVFQLLEQWPGLEVIFREKSTDRVSSGRSIRLSWSPGGNLGEDEQVRYRWYLVNYLELVVPVRFDRSHQLADCKCCEAGTLGLDCLKKSCVVCPRVLYGKWVLQLAPTFDPAALQSAPGAIELFRTSSTKRLFTSCSDKLSGLLYRLSTKPSSRVVWKLWRKALSTSFDNREPPWECPPDQV